MIENYVLIALSRFGNAVLDKKLCKQYGTSRVLDMLRDYGFNCKIEIIDKTYIAKVVKENEN